MNGPRSIALRHAVGALLLTMGCVVSAMAASDTVRAVRSGEVCPTNGKVQSLKDDELEVDSASSRAVMKTPDDTFGQIRFQYLGPTTEDVPFASGTMRRQVGIKLKAADSCNVIYAMWRIEPESDIIVTTKINPGKSKHSECGVKGYKLVEPIKTVPVSPIEKGQWRSMAASIDGSMLTVQVDGSEVWRGRLDAKALRLDGYSGFRTDNARVKMKFLAREEPRQHALRSSKPRTSCHLVD